MRGSGSKLAWIIALSVLPFLSTVGEAGPPCGYLALGLTSSFATAINNSDEIVGTEEILGGEHGILERRGFLWKQGVMTDLTVTGYNIVSPEGINNRSQVVGYLDNSRFFVPPSSNPPRAFLWEKGVVIDLGILPGDTDGVSYAFAVNDRGQVVGEVSSLQTRGFLWEKGVMRALNPLPSHTSSVAMAINNRGQVSGYSVGPEPDFQTSAVVWEPDGRIVQLDRLPGDDRAYAFGINNRGQVVGYSWDSHSNEPHAVVWDDGAVIDLGVLPGYDYGSVAFAINNKGQVVGNFQSSFLPLRSFLWEGGVMTVLDLLPDLDGSYATAINDRGNILLNFSANNGGRPYLLKPCHAQ
jgi:probable HAF family extracellular repeat protein